MSVRKRTPSQTRVAAVAARRLGLGNALAQLRADFSGKSALGVFLEWRSNPVTLVMLDSLRELAMSPPVSYIDCDGVDVQYGVSSGLSLAASFMADPGSVFPDLFGGAAPGQPPRMPVADYTVDGSGGPAGADKGA